MFHQKAQDIPWPDSTVKVRLTEEQFTLPRCLLGIIGVQPSKEKQIGYS